MELIREDRREDRRYPIELELRYKVMARSRDPLQGQGRTLNMSSGGILFGGDQSLPTGAFIEVSINWPVLLQGSCPLSLLVVGRVVRSENNRVAVRMKRYEFMTRQIRNAKDSGSGNPKIYIA
jgi:hypothetical protein